MTAQLDVVATSVWRGIVNFVLFGLVVPLIGPWVSADQETEKLDLARHGERGYGL